MKKRFECGSDKCVESLGKKKDDVTAKIQDFDAKAITDLDLNKSSEFWSSAVDDVKKNDFSDAIFQGTGAFYCIQFFTFFVLLFSVGFSNFSFVKLYNFLGGGLNSYKNLYYVEKKIFVLYISMSSKT